jgi:translation elongation factor P/translation initiation factor 5A
LILENFVTALLHILILDPNSKLASKLYRVYTRNVKKGGTYLPLRKEFTIKMKNCTYQQKQGTNIYGFCVMDSMFHFLNKNTYEEHKIEVTY